MSDLTIGNVDSRLAKVANSVLGLFLARFVTPGLLALVVFFGGRALDELTRTLEALALRMTAAEGSIQQINQEFAAAEARREVSIKARDLDIAALTTEIQLLRQKTDSSTTAIAAQSAQIEIVLDMLKELRSNLPTKSTFTGSNVQRGG